MHQEHNIPWNILASNFKYVHEDRSFTPPYSGFIPLNRPTQSNELNHFARKLISTIHEFAVTERKKYPSAQELMPPVDGMVFSDELREKYPQYLDSRNQKLDFWTRSADYNTSNGDLADVVKILIHENQMQTLLMLANHPLIPLHTLKFLSWGHEFGFHRIVETALGPYIFWNLMAVTGQLASGLYKHLKTYQLVVRDTTMIMDFEAQQIPHWEFYGLESGLDDKHAPTVEPARLHEYLKHLFCLLYRYDMLLSECGVDPAWIREMGYTFSSYFSIGLKSEQDAEGQWIYYF